MCASGLATLSARCKDTQDPVMTALVADVVNAGCINATGASTGPSGRHYSVTLTLRDNGDADNREVDTASMKSIVQHLLGIQRSGIQSFAKSGQTGNIYTFDVVSNTLYRDDIVSLLASIGVAVVVSTEFGMAPVAPTAPTDPGTKHTTHDYGSFFAISISVSAMGTLTALFFYGVVGRVKRFVARSADMELSETGHNVLNEPLDFEDDISWLPVPDASERNRHAQKLPRSSVFGLRRSRYRSRSRSQSW